MIHTTDNLEQLKQELDAVRKQGQTIGFTHGVFDLLHQGHLYLLMSAAQKCDYLLVGIDSDESVKKYKSQDRPIYDEEHRRNIIDSMQFVNQTLIHKFDPTPDNYAEIYREIEPDIIFVGTSFGYLDHLKEIQHQNKSFEVEVIDLLIVSTTDVVAKIRTTTP